MWGLREIPPPEAISWMPQTWGWGLLAIVLLLCLAWLGYRQYRSWQSRAYRRAAIADLDRMKRDPIGLAGLPALLRKTALCGFPREEVAYLNGEAWIDWLNGEGATFLTEDAVWLDHLAYQPRLSSELESESAARLITASLRFVRGHRARV